MLRFAQDGAESVRAALTGAELARLADALAPVDTGAPGARLSDELAPVADLLAPDGGISRVASRFGDRPMHAVRATLFDKRADGNWALGLHQDRTIAVRERRDVPGFGPWTVKAGRPHVEPPFAVISALVTLRVHLDPVDADNAPLLVLPGSHRLGRLPERAIEALDPADAVPCHAEAGDFWAYRTAIVHGSAPVRGPPRTRRVLQFDYASDALPGGLRWAEVGLVDDLDLAA